MFYRGGVEGCAGTGGHAAADERGDIEWNIAINRNHGTAQAIGSGGETGYPHRGEQRGAGLIAGIGHRITVGDRVLAEVHFAPTAEPAVLAGSRPRDHHVVTGTDVVHLGAHLFDHAGTLVAEDAWRACGQGTGRLRQI